MHKNSLYFKLNESFEVNEDSLTKEDMLSCVEYSIQYVYEKYDKEIFATIHKNEMIYNVGDMITYKDKRYEISKITRTNNGYNVYLNKKRVSKEIDKEKAESILKDRVDKLQLKKQQEEQLKFEKRQLEIVNTLRKKMADRHDKYYKKHRFLGGN